MSPVEEEIASLRSKAVRLIALLDDAQPGTAMWAIAVGHALDALAETAPSYERQPPRRPR